MLEQKFLRFFWVILLVASAFTLGYTLKPTTGTRPIGAAGMGVSRGMAPPLNFGGHR
jgi:hypothetical protein